MGCPTEDILNFSKLMVKEWPTKYEESAKTTVLKLRCLPGINMCFQKRIKAALQIKSRSSQGEVLNQEEVFPDASSKTDGYQDGYQGRSGT